MLPGFFIHLQTYFWHYSRCIKLGVNSNEYITKQFLNFTSRVLNCVFSNFAADNFQTKSAIVGIVGMDAGGLVRLFLDQAGYVNTSQAVYNPRRLF